MTDIANWKMTIEIVNFPINSMVIFHSYVSLPEGSIFFLQQDTHYISLYYTWALGMQDDFSEEKKSLGPRSLHQYQRGSKSIQK